MIKLVFMNAKILRNNGLKRIHDEDGFPQKVDFFFF